MMTVREMRRFINDHPGSAFIIRFRNGEFTSGRVRSVNDKEISIAYDPVIDQLQSNWDQQVSNYHSLLSIHTARFHWNNIESIELFFN